FQHGSPRYLPLHRALADALADPAFDEYDAVLLDCAPNFTMVTRTGIVASDHLIVPAKPDYLSTLGIDYLRRKLSELVGDYNRAVGPGLARSTRRSWGWCSPWSSTAAAARSSPRATTSPS